MTGLKRRFDFSDVNLYAVSTTPKPGRTYQEMAESACAGGADVFQLREKTMGTRELIRLCKDIRTICDKFGTMFILNDRVDVAWVSDADGVHLGQEDFPVRKAREILGHKKIIGCSTHSVAQAFQAQGDGADYVGCGPVFSTPTKPDYKPVGLDLVRQYASMVKIPFVAIGGIDETNVEDVIAAGAKRVAVVRAVCGAENVEEAARRMKIKIFPAMKISAVV